LYVGASPIGTRTAKKSLQNIGITKRTWQMKEAMPNPQVLGCHFFKTIVESW
jgi:hypothetical protein